MFTRMQFIIVTLSFEPQGYLPPSPSASTSVLSAEQRLKSLAALTSSNTDGVMLGWVQVFLSRSCATMRKERLGNGCAWVLKSAALGSAMRHPVVSNRSG